MAKRVAWEIVVVHYRPGMPPAASLRHVGAAPTTIVRYARVRREMSPAGLRRKLRAQRN